MLRRSVAKLAAAAKSAPALEAAGLEFRKLDPKKLVGELAAALSGN